MITKCYYLEHLIKLIHFNVVEWLTLKFVYNFGFSCSNKLLHYRSQVGC